jgi:exodeoxyribonuclease V alpha subunit
MQIENDYDKEVYNGDIGTIDDVDLNTAEIAVGFDGRSVTYQLGELDMLVPAYAATIFLLPWRSASSLRQLATALLQSKY